MKPNKNITQKSFISPDYQFMGEMWENCKYGPKIINKKVILDFIYVILNFLNWFT